MAKIDIFERIKNRYKYIAYSPMLDRLILLNGGKIELVKNGKHIKFYYEYSDEQLFGKTMNANILEKFYTEIIGEV